MLQAAIAQGIFFFSSRRRHTRLTCDWSSDVCSSDLGAGRAIDGHADSFVSAGAALILESEIGRASCRERVEISGEAGSLKKKKSNLETEGASVERRTCMGSPGTYQDTRATITSSCGC